MLSTYDFEVNCYMFRTYTVYMFEVNFMYIHEVKNKMLDVKYICVRTRVMNVKYI
jgi:hypothetical protein